jgi:SAM-dependent methyltransferase
MRSEFARLPETQGGSLLDLGCGTRPYSHLYRDRFCHCIAGDYTIRGPIDVRLDAGKLPFSNGTFDVVLMSEVIEHVPSTVMVLAEVSRVLKPGGLLLITWPFNYMLHEIPNDHVRYTEFGMAGCLDKVGMKIEHLFRRGNALMLMLVLGEFLVGGFLEIFARLPVIGKVFRPVKDSFVSLVFGAAYHFYFLLTWRRTYVAQGLVGGGLTGPVGHLSLWNLGYCARVRKLGGLQ